ncbi:hypothetical protein HPP92_015377 [Vanilla planifolia]|uniref:Uncharacterized protein n=1 Tax=Vanilla planifolia TaxID=51239 RepID=A0A835QNF9_VANPL|nr:hypothetical protein HPP92_015377 [Vanilla planifolia]
MHNSHPTMEQPPEVPRILTKIPAKVGEEPAEEESVTPKSENCILKPPTECPPPPRKPLAELQPNRFSGVPRDLTADFNRLPLVVYYPQKRIQLW